jgi:hypothetical protein
MNSWLFASSFLSILASSILSGCTVTPVKNAEVRAPLEIPSGTQTKSIEFRKVLTKIPLGEQIGKIHYGWGCFPGANIGWRGGRLNITDEELTETFRNELQGRNYQIVGDPYALFGDPSAWQAEILVAGLVTKVDTQVCFPFSGTPTADIGNTTALKGGAFMRVTWQIFSRAEGKVVHEITTEGSYQSEEVISGGFPIFLRNAFAANVINLLADRGFHDLVLKHGDQQAEQSPKRNKAQDI